MGDAPAAVLVPCAFFFFFFPFFLFVCSEALWQRKQSDVLRFLLRTRCWEYRNQPVIARVNRPTRLDKARRLGFKAKQG